MSNDLLATVRKLPSLAVEAVHGIEQIHPGAQMFIVMDPTKNLRTEGNTCPMVLSEAWWKGMRVRLRFRCCADPRCTRELKLEGAWHGKHPQSTQGG